MNYALLIINGVSHSSFFIFHSSFPNGVSLIVHYELCIVHFLKRYLHLTVEATAKNNLNVILKKLPP